MRFINNLIGIAISVFLVSCSTTRYVNRADYSLSDVDAPKASNITIGNGTYSDDDIDLTASLRKNVIQFNLVNKSEGTVRINWDNGAYIDETGNSLRILHSGVRIIDKEKPQVASVIAKGSRFSDEIYVSDYVKVVNGQLVFEPLLGYNAFDTKAEAESRLDDLRTEVRLLLPIEVNGESRDYIFSFKCDNAYTEVQQEYDYMKSLWAITGISGGLSLLIVIMSVAAAM